MSKRIEFINYVSALSQILSTKKSSLALDTAKIYYNLSELLSRYIILEAESLDANELIKASPALCFALASTSELAKNFLDPKLKITAITISVKIDSILNLISITISDNGPGFSLIRVPFEQICPVADVLGLVGPLSRGASSKVKGDHSGGGCGRGLAQVCDWYSALNLNTRSHFTIHRVNKNGGCAITFSSPIAKQVSEKERCDKAIASVLAVFDDRLPIDMKNNKMKTIQDDLNPELTDADTSTSLDFKPGRRLRLVI
ncbi:MAG: sensor histidine kinase [Gammaproteobacteria bacterium]|nr:sensor histidine kinase [Gammaproteobacteria bacterium]